MTRRHLTTFTLAVLLGCGSAVAAPPAAAAGSTFWVDGAAGCSTSGPGTPTSPYCTISAAVAKAVAPGDTVRVRPGTYREQVTLAASGAPGSPIALVGDAAGVVILGTRSLSDPGLWTPTATNAWTTPYAPPSAPRLVRVDGQALAVAASATSTTAGSFFYNGTTKVLSVDLGGANPGLGHQVEAGAQSFGVAVTGRHDVLVSGLETRDQNFAGVRVRQSGATTVDSVTASGSAGNGLLVELATAGVRIQSSTVVGAASTGVRVSDSPGVVVSGTESHHNGLHGIGLTSSPGVLLSRDVVHDNVVPGPSSLAAGIDVNGASTDAVLRGNLSWGNEDTGIQVYGHSDRALLVRNVSRGNGDHGFDVLDSSAARLLGNTAVRNTRDGISVEGTSTGATTADNVLVDNGEATREYDLYVDAASSVGFAGDHDLAYNSSSVPVAKVNGTVYRRLADLAAATGLEAHGLDLDPALVDAAHGDVRLSPGSPAVDAADTTVNGYDPVDQTGRPAVDDPLVTDRGVGTPTFADLGALEQQPPAGAVDYPPHAALVADPRVSQVPPSTPVTLDARGSSDVDATGVVTYTFEFGDGTSAGPQTEPTVVHRFSAVGTYRVQVTVTDAGGLQSTASDSVRIDPRVLRTLHVSVRDPACSDAGPASTAVPLCTMSAAAKQMLAGDTALVEPGVYREQVRAGATGEPGAPVTWRGTGPGVVVSGADDVSAPSAWSATSTSAWKRPWTPTSSPAQVLLDGAPLAKAPSASATTPGSWYYDPAAATLWVDVGGANPGVGHLVEAGSRNFGLLLRSVAHYDVSNIAVTATNLTGAYLDLTDHVSLDGVEVSLAGAYGVTVDGSTATRLSNIGAHRNGSVGVRFAGSQDGELARSVSDHNAFHGVSVQDSRGVRVLDVTAFANLRPGTRVAAGVDVSSGSVGTLVDRVTAYGNDDSGVNISMGSSGTVVRRSVSRDNGDHGVDASNAPQTSVVGNTVVGNQTAGINFEGGSTGGSSFDNIAVDNALASSRTIGQIRVDEASEPGTTLNRDLVFSSTTAPLFEWGSQPYLDLAAFQTASGQEGAGLAANPRFTDLGARRLDLRGDSPAVDAAWSDVAGWSPLDLVGASPVDHPSRVDTARGPGAPADLGALEYVGPVAAGDVTPLAGAAPLDVTVDAGRSTALGAPLAGWQWDCGNGQVISVSVGTCRYTAAGTYRPTLLVTDTSGRSDPWTGPAVTVTLDSPPAAAMTATPSRAYAPQDVVLDASGSTDTDSTPISGYAMDCGQGETRAVGPSPTFTCHYTRPGQYVSAVTVVDAGGLTSTVTSTVQILADVAPSAVLTVSPSAATAGGSVQLSGAQTTSVDKSPPASYRFDCGNGLLVGPQASPTTTCTYPAKGNYKLRLWVTDTVGLTGTDTVTLVVKK